MHIYIVFIALLAKNKAIHYFCIIVLRNTLLGDEIGRHALLSRG